MTPHPPRAPRAGRPRPASPPTSPRASTHASPRASTHASRHASDRASTQAGSVSVEMVVFVVPFLVLLTLFTVFCGRSASAAIDVHAAAAAAARSAADTLTPPAAITAATSAVAATTAGTAWACTPTVDTTDLRAGGQVSVDVACQIPLSDLGLPGLTTDRVVHAHASEPVDTYRANPGGFVNSEGLAGTNRRDRSVV